MKQFLITLSGIVTLFIISIRLCAQDASAKRIKTILVFFDGLRPDYVTPGIMPNLYSWRTTGSYNPAHHSIFPTFTRVNSAGYATGSYPGTNGLMGNEVYFPQIDPFKSLNTAQADVLDKLMTTTGGQLLTAVSLGEVLSAAGQQLMVFSNGSVGQAFFQNHKLNGAVIHPEWIRPVSIQEDVTKRVGAPPPFEELNKPRHQWITNALISYALQENGPLVSAIWYTDPDETTHVNGIGSSLSLQSLRIVDEQFGRLLNSLREAGKQDAFNIIVSADHGFITLKGNTDPTDLLIRKGIKESYTSDDVVLADNAIFVKKHDTAVIRRIVNVFQREPWVGPIFTSAIAPNSDLGWVQGTFSFQSIHWNHPQRTADILLSAHWDDMPNEAGYAGTSYAKGWKGSHGGISPYEINIGLIARGPSFKKKYTGKLPSSNVDIVPTVLYLNGLPIPSNMDGRVLHELLKDDRQQLSIPVKTELITTSAACDTGTYTIELERSVLGQYRYVNYGRRN